MPDILHRIAARSSRAEAYKAVTVRDRLAGWWTTDTRGKTAPGQVLEFHFGGGNRIDMKVVEVVTDRWVLWQAVKGPEEWIGTSVSFEFASDGAFTIILFKHEGWREPVEFMHHCSTKWALFLMSLKSLLESGRGAPYPDDVRISHREG